MSHKPPVRKLISIPATNTDAPAFIDRVERVVCGAAALYLPRAVRLLLVDDWFDSKWLEFSGKMVGAVGVWRSETTVPPFHPNRILDERQFALVEDPAEYRPVDTPTPLHRGQPSERNLRRRLKVVAPNSALFWYSARSLPNRRGAVMAYVPNAEGNYWTWYAELVAATPQWTLHRVKGISPEEFGKLGRVNEDVDAHDV